MGAITYEVKVDWAGNNWTDTPTFGTDIDDISDYTKTVSYERGKDKELGNSPAATLELRLNNEDGRFSPPNASGPLYSYLIPWKIIRVRAYHNAVWYNEFFGFINRYMIEPHWDVKEAYIYATDGMDVLARQIITQDNDIKTSLREDEAIARILDAAGWASSRRSLDADGQTLTEYPECSVF